jgi:hypothetical protein
MMPQEDTDGTGTMDPKPVIKKKPIGLLQKGLSIIIHAADIDCHAILM